MRAALVVLVVTSLGWSVAGADARDVVGASSRQGRGPCPGVDPAPAVEPAVRPDGQTVRVTVSELALIEHRPGWLGLIVARTNTGARPDADDELYLAERGAVTPGGRPLAAEVARAVWVPAGQDPGCGLFRWVALAGPSAR